MAFRNSQAPVAVCRHILDHSNSEQAKFQVAHSANVTLSLGISAQLLSLQPVVLQAVVTLRDAAVREWATTPKQDQRALRGYVLHHILRHAYLTALLQRILRIMHADFQLMQTPKFKQLAKGRADTLASM